MSSRLILVTGAAGKLGGVACRALQVRGWRVRALRHEREPVVYDELIDGSLEDLEALIAATRGAEAVLHLAAATHARRSALYERVNVSGTANLVEALRQGGTGRLVLVSTRSIAASGGSYSNSKSEAERIVRSSGVHYTIVRLPEVYGVGGSEGVDRLISLARSGRRIPLVAADSAELCPTHVDDVVAALVRAADGPKSEHKTYTLAGECMTPRQFARICVETFGSASSIVDVPIPAVRLLATLSRFLPIPVYPDQLARLLAPKPEPSPDALQDLGFSPRSVRVGLAAFC
jgi:nucleoside-diphosphate-sugar epimerase